MATIRKRGEFQWEAQIRRKGYPAVSMTFEIKVDWTSPDLVDS